MEALAHVPLDNLGYDTGDSNSTRKLVTQPRLDALKCKTILFERQEWVGMHLVMRHQLTSLLVEVITGIM